MNKKWYPYILIGLLLAVLIIVKIVKKEPLFNNPSTTTTTKDPASVNRDRGFDRRISYLKYSEHAKCRMKCRKITQVEVEQIMKEGKINYNKSDLQNARCPRYAVEGITRDDQRVRIVYAQCNESTTVVTVIDLETDYECHCPGDDDKYDNKR
ncbi:MAG TPA: DUF4258 domain-containing protein [Chitinophagaceae bacterium]|nr:DUF4258 domain-containing protein [Chitinophagales bacterium]HPG12456.1 DUF4258 domain-containing protein [Chitinophagaceae bacterium]HRX93686.1 DUF4258 domain-containing protein [Chitinophagaceae bacterium]